MECLYIYFTNAVSVVLDAYYVTIQGDLIGIIPPGDSINTEESLAGTTLKVTGPFTAYDPSTKILVTANGQRIQLLQLEKTKVLSERTKAWLKTLV